MSFCRAAGRQELLPVAPQFDRGIQKLPASSSFDATRRRVAPACLAGLLSTPLSRATQIAAATGQGLALVFGFVGLFANPFLGVISYLLPC